MRALGISVLGLMTILVFLIGCGDATVAADPGESCAVDADCTKGASCQIGTCDLDKMECSYAVKDNYCLVNNACHVAGEVHKTDKCKECNPAANNTDWVAVQCLTGQICASEQGCVDEQLACQGDDSACATEDPCMSGSCGANGFCTFTPVPGASCDDGDECTSDDLCDASGACAAGNYTCACSVDDDCPAGNACQKAVCTDNACSLVSLTDGTGCDDLDGCTEKDACSAGVCVGTPVQCTGGDACNDPVCVGGECTTAAAEEGSQCDDNNDCTTEDACDASGTCLGNWDSSVCACQNDADCAGTAGQCQVGVCNNGQCESQDAENGGSCDDGNPCTSNTICQGGACDSATGSPVTCPETGNPCTYQSCDPASGCMTKNNAVTTACNDGLYCTTNDHCDGNGTCVGGGATLCPNDNDQNQCTTKVCDESSNSCVNDDLANGTACTPSTVCAEDASCQNGNCMDGNAVTCPNIDNNSCTVETCVSEGNAGCQVTGNKTNGSSCGKDGAICENGECVTPECTKDSHCDDDPCKIYQCKNQECVQVSSVYGPCGDKKACVGGECTDVECTVASDCTGACKLWECKNSSYTCNQVGSMMNGSSCMAGKISGTCQQGKCQTGGGFQPGDPGKK